MTARSIASVLACAIILTGCLLALPGAEGSPDDRTDTDNAVLDTVLSKLGKEGEFGAFLKLNEKETIQFADIVADVLSPEIADKSPFLEYLKGTENPDLGDFILSQGSDYKEFEIGADGELRIQAISKKTDDGFQYTIRLNGNLTVKEDVQLAATDEEHEDKALKSNIVVKIGVDAVAVILANKEAVPYSIESKAVVSYSETENSNFDRVWKDFNYTGDKTTEVHLDITASLYSSIDGGLTSAELKDILENKNVQKRISAGASVIVGNKEKKLIDGFELSIDYDLGELYGSTREAIIGNESSDDQQAGKSYSERLYFILQEFLENRGVFLSEQTYNSVIDALKDVKKQILNGNGGFYYDIDGNQYNTGIRDDVVKSLNQKIDTDYDRIINSGSEYVLSYSKDYRDRYLTAEAEGVDVPTKIAGFDVKENKEEPESNYSIGSYEGRLYIDDPNKIDESNKREWLITIYTELPNDDVFQVKADESIKEKIHTEKIESPNYTDRWYLKITTGGSPYELLGYSIVVKYGECESEIHFTSYYGDRITTIDEVTYAIAVYATAIFTSSTGTITIPSEISLDGKDFEVNNIRFSGIVLDNLILDADTMNYVDLGNSKIKTVSLTGKAESINLGRFVGLDNVTDFTFGNDIKNTFGSLKIPDWKGIGGSFESDGATYRINLRGGEEIVELIGVTTDAISIPETVSNNDKTYRITGANLNNISLNSLSIEHLRSITLSDSNIAKLTIGGTFIHADDDSHIGTLTIRGSNPIYVDADSLKDISATQIVFECDIDSVVGDVSHLEKFRIIPFEKDGITYLKMTVNNDDVLQFYTISEGSKSIIIHEKISCDGKDRTVNGRIDAFRNRSIETVYIESMPKDGIDLSESSIVTLQFVNKSSIDLEGSHFYGCDRLKEVIFNGPVKSIPSNAFSDSTEIRSIAFNADIDRIGSYAFPSNGYITSLTFKGEVGEIDHEAFGSFTKLKTVVFERDVKVINRNAFSECSELKSIEIKGDIGELNGFYGCNNLSSIAVGGTIGLIDNGAFSNKTANQKLSLTFDKIKKVDYFAFIDCILEQTVINNILEKSEFVSPSAFENVKTVQSINTVDYTGVSSNENESEITVGSWTYTYSIYIEDGQQSLNIVGVRQSSDASQNILNIPTSIKIDDKDYPVKSIAEFRARGENSITDLTIGNNIKHIGSCFPIVFPKLTTITLTDTSLFGIEKFNTDSFSMLYEKQNSGKSIICTIGTLNVEELTIPDGIDYCDMDWFHGSTIKTIHFGNSVTEIQGQFNMLKDLEIIVLGKNINSINTNWILPGVYIESKGINYISNNGSLYRIINKDTNEVELVHHYCKEGNSSNVISSFSIESKEYKVVSIGDGAFNHLEIDSLTLSSGMENLDLDAFSYSKIGSVAVPDSINNIYGTMFEYKVGMTFSSPDKKTVRTIDGMVYHDVDNCKTIVAYTGNGKDTVFVEEGTISVDIPGIKDNNIKHLILPSSVKTFNGYYESNDHSMDVLIPFLANDRIDRSDMQFHFRPYTTSDDYIISFKAADDGISVNITTKDYAKFTSVSLSGKTITDSGTISFSWSDLFPELTGKTNTYSEKLSVSYALNIYTVSFDTGSVDAIDSQMIEHGKRATTPQDPLNGTMVFDGWYKDSEFTELFDFDSPIESDTTIYAKWSTPNCNVNFTLGDGIHHIVIGEYWFWSGESGKIPYGTYELEVALEEGYEGSPVVRLNGNAVQGTNISLNQASIDISVDGCAKKTLTVHFVNNISRGSCSVESLSTSYGETFDLPKVAPSGDYRFVGWTDGISLINGSYSVKEDSTLFAAYVRDTEKLEFFLSEYTVTLSIPANGSISSASYFKADKGDTISLPTVIPSDGYRFDGWVSEGRNVGTSFTVLGNAELVASISKIGSSVSPSEPADPPAPAKPDVEEKVNEDGSTTVIEKNEDGSSTETTTKKNDDGSTVVKTEEKDKNGSSVGTTTKTTLPDGSSTEVKEAATENGSFVKEEKFDKDGNSMGSTTKVTEKTTTDEGTVIEKNTVTAADGAGDKVAETVTVKAESENGKVKSEAFSKNDGKSEETTVKTTLDAAADDGRIDVDPEDISEALKQMDDVLNAVGSENGSKTLEIGSKTVSDSTEVKIPAESMKEISDAGADVKIAGDVGTITVGSEVSKNLAEKSSEGESPKEISISIGKASISSMTVKQQEAVGDSKVFKLQATVGDESIHELGGDVTVSIPYVLSPGEDPDFIRVYYVDDDGGLHMKLTTYDPETHTVSFVTDHFSYYMIGTQAQVVPDDAAEDGGNTLAIIAVAAVAVVAFAAVAALLIRRRP